MKYSIVIIFLPILFGFEISAEYVDFTAENKYLEIGETAKFLCNISTVNLYTDKVPTLTVKYKDGTFIACMENCMLYNSSDCWQFDGRGGNCTYDGVKASFILRDITADDFTSFRCSIGRNMNDTTLHQFVPSVVTWTDNTTFTHNDGLAFDLSCYIHDGEPTVSAVNWYINDLLTTGDHIYFDSVSGISTIHLNATKSLHQSNVTCEAFQLNGRDLIPSEVMVLNITWPPVKASAVNESVIGIVGKVVLLECYINSSNAGNPDYYNFTWTRKGDSDYKQITVGGKLELIPQNECWQDTYSCLPSNVGGSGLFAEIILNLNVTPDIHLPEVHTSYIENDLSLVCSCTGIPEPSIHWYTTDAMTPVFNSTTIIETGDCGLIEHSSTLLWSDIASNDDKKSANNLTVFCFCENSIPFPCVSSALLNITYPPGKASLQSQQNEINVNESVVMTCAAENQSEHGNPDLYQYKFNSSENWESDWQTNNSCEISIFTCDTFITCNLRNYPYSNEWRKGTLSDKSELIIYVPPEIRFPTSNEHYEPLYDDPVFVISCKAIGKPNVSLSLYKNGISVSTSDFTKATTTYQLPKEMYGLNNGVEGNFTWQSVNIGETCDTITHFDSSNYQCHASNYGTDFHEVISANIEIKTKYSALWNGNSSVVYSEYNQSQIDIVCDICAYPSTTFEWYRNGTKLDGEANNILTVYNVGSDDFTSYICEASNDVGSINFTILLEPDSAPAMINRGVSSITSISLTVTWDSYHGGNPPVQFYVYFKETRAGNYTLWSDNISSSTDGDTLSEDILNLNCSTAYDVKVEAKNGRVEDNTDTIVIAGSSTYAQPQININSAELRGKELTVQWIYSNPMIALENLCYEVTVRVVYWKTGHEEKILYPEEDYPAINATDESVVFTDDRLTSDHVVDLIIYENGFLNSARKPNPVDPHVITEGLSTGGIIGIVLLAMIVMAIPILTIFIYSGRVKVPWRTDATPDNPTIRRNATEMDFNCHLAFQQSDENALPVYAAVNKNKKSTQAATDEIANTYENVAFEDRRPPIAPKPCATPMKQKPLPHELPPTRTIDADGCIYMHIKGLEFPNYKPPQKGKQPVIHGINNLTVYATIDFNARAPTPLPEYVDEEEEVMCVLPEKRQEDN